MSVKFSVIIPVYHCAPYLESCVASIQAQTLGPYEILLIDDGSGDACTSICDRLAAEDGRIRAFHKENGGAASARNYGLDRASGDWILFVDGDDTLAPDCLEQLAPLLSADAMVIFGLSFDYYRRERLVRSERCSCRFQGACSVPKLADSFSDFFGDNQLSSACNKLFDRTLVERFQLRFAQGVTQYEDFDFVLRYLRRASAVVCVPQPFYHYRNDLVSGHLMRRVSELGQIEKNLKQLNGSLIEFYDCFPRQSVLAVAFQVSRLLLDQHLLFGPVPNASRLRAELPGFLSRSGLSDVISRSAQPDAADSRVLEQIEAGEFSAVARQYRKRRLRAAIRRAARRVLK